MRKLEKVVRWAGWFDYVSGQQSISEASTHKPLKATLCEAVIERAI